MPKFKCKYEECVNFDKPVTVSKASFRFDEKQQKMVLRGEYRCSICHNEMEFVPGEETAIRGFHLNKFDGLPDKEKRAIIRKRSQEHFKRTDKGDLQNYKNKIIRDNKRMMGDRS